MEKPHVQKTLLGLIGAGSVFAQEVDVSGTIKIRGGEDLVRIIIGEPVRPQRKPDDRPSQRQIIQNLQDNVTHLNQRVFNLEDAARIDVVANCHSGEGNSIFCKGRKAECAQVK